MKYMALIYGAEIQQSQADIEAEMAAYYAFGAALESRGIPDVGEALHPASTATTVRVIDGKTVTTDGPFAETKEVLGGYYLLDCKDLDEAIELAAMIPGAKRGCVEVRPIVVWG